MKYQTLKIDRTGPVQLITLNRPDVLNAMNFDMLHDLKEAFARISRDIQIRAVILTGAEDRAFCAGADLKERRQHTVQDIHNYNVEMQKFTYIENLNKPVIAAINGIALGGGTEIALACDLRIAVPTAVMGLIETRLGIIPGAGGTQRLPRLVGSGKAKEIIFTGRRIYAREALEIGLINKLCPRDSLMDDAFRMAHLITRNGPIAVAQAKLAINQGLLHDMQTGFKIESEAYHKTLHTEDRIEGLAAFEEKRQAVYTGR